MKTIVESGSQNWSETSEVSKQCLFDGLTVANALTCRVGHQLANIIRGEITPLELMMEDRLLHRYYQEVPQLKDRTLKHFRQMIELYCGERTWSQGV
jgi:hypothetical protein